MLAADINVASGDSIQSAITSATSGDVLILAAATYSECLEINGKNLTIRGASTSTTTIDGSSCSTSNQNNTIMVTEGIVVHFEQISLNNSNGRAVEIHDSTLTLDNIDVSDSGNNSLNGAAIMAYSDAIVTINNSNFEDNGANGSNTVKGGVIHVDDNVNLTINDSHFEDSYAYKGGAIFALNNSSITINNSTFEGNQASYTGGAIMLDPSASSSQNTLTIEGSTFTNNTIDTNSNSAGAGGTIYVNKETEINIANSQFSGSSSTSHGGTLHLDGIKETAVLNNVTFQNSSAMGRGGVIYAQSNGSQNPIDLQITSCTFENSSAYNFGGAIALGTGVHLGSYTSLNVTSSTFHNNSTDNSQDGFGGAIAVFGTWESSNSGTESVSITSSSFSGNEAELRGGGLFVQGLSSLTVAATKFIDNDVQGQSGSETRWGGGVFVDQTDSVVLSNSFFGGNTVVQGTSSSAIGGGFLWSKPQLL